MKCCYLMKKGKSKIWHNLAFILTKFLIMTIKTLLKYEVKILLAFGLSLF